MAEVRLIGSEPAKAQLSVHQSSSNFGFLKIKEGSLTCGKAK